MKNVYDLEKRLVSNGYNVEIVSYGSNDVSDVHGNIFPACYRDCIVVTFRVCEGAENPVSMESNFLKYIKRQKDFTIYDNPLCYAGQSYIITDKASAAELYADAKMKKFILNEYWQERHAMYLSAEAC